MSNGFDGCLADAHFLGGGKIGWNLEGRRIENVTLSDRFNIRSKVCFTIPGEDGRFHCSIEERHNYGRA